MYYLVCDQSTQAGGTASADERSIRKLGIVINYVTFYFLLGLAFFVLTPKKDLLMNKCSIFVENIKL